MSNELIGAYGLNRTEIGAKSTNVLPDVPNMSTVPSADKRDRIADVEVLQIVSAERVYAVYKSGNKRPVACWAVVRSKRNQEVYVTGLVAGVEGTDGARLELAGTISDMEKYTPF